MSDRQDRLMHVLLCELLGGERPPDLTDRILARAVPAPGPAWRWFLRVAAAAALVTVAAAAWLVFQPAYPGPKASGDYRVAGAGPVARGAALRTGRGAARIELGGYCQVDLAPDTAVRIAGQPHHEAIHLGRGALRCRVDRARGRFGVHTDVGTVSVTGTEFDVRLVEGKGGAKMIGKRMVVRVLMGAVLLHGAWGSMELAAGEEATVGQGTIHAGKPVYREKKHAAWAEKGRVVGPIRVGAPACKIELIDKDGKVAATSDRPAGAKGYETVFLVPGVYTLRVSAAGYVTCEVKELEVRARHDVSVAVEFVAAGEQAPPPGEKVIHAGKPVYREKKHEAWAEKGRIIGPVRPGAPACKIEVLSATGAVVKSATLAKGAKGFELGFLDPGAYTLRVTAEGYPKLEVKGLAVRAKADLSLAIEFN